MSDSYLDHLPSRERERIMKRLRSPEEYERLRERVKGPEDLERELGHSERMAELRFSLESEQRFRDELKAKVEKDLREQGMENVLDLAPASVEAQQALEQGKFILTVAAHPQTHVDQLTVVPEGTVQEKLPIKPQVSERYAGGLQQAV